VALPLAVGLPVRADDSAASEEIRRALARELHDRVAQTLTTMLIELENFKVEQTGRQSVLRQLDEIQDSTRDVLANLRHVLFELRGETGVEEGLVDAVRLLLARFQDRTHVKVQLSISPSWPTKLRSHASTNIYRIVDEALTNVRMHSGAKAVEVVLRLARSNHLAVEIKDDGRGVDSELGGGAPGMGVLGMRERAVIMGGILEVETGLELGTTVRAIIPMEQVI
jgi:two-component system, NarL family, sensor histidine kinase UhpB